MKKRRKKFIVEGNFQTRFILRFVAVVIGATLLSTVAIVGLFFIKYHITGVNIKDITIMINGTQKTNPATFFEIILAPLIISNMIVLCIVIPVSLFYSHKIAGPIYRFEQSLDLLLNGKTNFMIALRKKDEFKYLADKMNALIDFLRRNIDEVKLSHRVLRDRISKLNRILTVEPIDIPQLKKEIIELERFFKDRGLPFSY